MDWKKYVNRETISYLIFGVLTTIVDWAVYMAFKAMNVNYLACTVLSWIAAVVFAFVTNKRIVFQSHDMSFLTILWEFIVFTGARLLTGAMNVAGMWLFVSRLHLYDVLAKAILSVLVVILNYFFSKWFVFKK